MSTNETMKDRIGFSNSEILSPEEFEKLKKENEVIEDRPVNRKAKIRELKDVIKLATEEYIAYTKKFREEEKVGDMTPEAKEEYQRAIGTRGAVLEGLREELKSTRMNKTGSKFFEFQPSAPNRRTRRAFAKLRRV